MHYKVLLLNADYTPYDIITWRRAFTLLYMKDHVVKKLADYPHFIRSGHGKLHAVPAVLVLNEYQFKINLPAPYSKLAVFLRDRFQCQYCGRKLDREHCTVDHVIPKHLFRQSGSKIRFSSFENTTTACKKCNSQKGYKTPSEAKMRLLSVPKAVTRAQLFASKLYLTKIPTEWEQYLNVKKES